MIRPDEWPLSTAAFLSVLCILALVWLLVWAEGRAKEERRRQRVAAKRAAIHQDVADQIGDEAMAWLNTRPQRPYNHETEGL